MDVDLIVFLVVLVVSYLLAPKQGDIPKAGYEMLVTLVGRKSEHTFHIHHWIYLLAILLIGGLARLVSPEYFRMLAIAILALVLSEFLKYSDAFRL